MRGVLPLLAVPVLVAQAPVSLRYRKVEAKVPMRDGVKLHTVLYLPRQPQAPFPILLHRTPYACHPYGAGSFPATLGPSERFSQATYAFVYQDVRGRYLSEGTFEDVRPAALVDETTDTWDTLEWLLKHVEGHNGRVGMWGISYPGHYTAQGMLCGHPALKAVSPQAPMVDLWEGDDSYHHGAFQLAATAGFFLNFRSRGSKPTLWEGDGVPPPARDGYRWYLAQGNASRAGETLFRGREPLWLQTLAHPTRDRFWQARDLRPRIRGVQPAVLTVGGWYDGENLFGALALDRTLARQSPQTRAHLVMGPWTHGAWANPDASRLGHLSFGENTARRFQQEVEFPFFEHHLRGTPAPPLPRAWLFETGTWRWRAFAAWPPAEARRTAFHFGPEGTLTLAAPAKPAEPDRFVSDPARPVPYTQAIAFHYHAPYMAEDQRFASTRPDVVVYQTEPLKADLTVAGPVQAVLHVSTSGTDSDWVVKLIDVWPEAAPTPAQAPPGWQAGGAQMLVRGEIFRGRYRQDGSEPRPFSPDQPEEVAFALSDVLHTFKKGHRLMVQVQCSWFPLADRNPQTFVDIATAPPEAYRKATQRIFREPGRASRIELGVLQ